MLDAYRSFNPAAWVGVYRILPTYAGILCMFLGVLLLLVGGGRVFRFVAAPLGALVGGVWINQLTLKFGLHLPERVVSLAATVLLAVVGFIAPVAVVFLSVGLPVGLVVGELAGNADWLLGFVPAFLVAGTVAAIMQRWVSAIVASFLGAWILVLGALSALHQVGHFVATVAQQPWGVIIAALLFAVAGSVYQLSVRPSPEEAEHERAERLRAKRQAEEKKALEKRWSNYSSDRK